MKASELSGAALDWAVGATGDYGCGFFSTDWAIAGPIIEREGICLSCVDTNAAWDARIYESDAEPWQGEGNTPLQAAMRCYVASVLGDEVEIPEELGVAA